MGRLIFLGLVEQAQEHRSEKDKRMKEIHQTRVVFSKIPMALSLGTPGCSLLPGGRAGNCNLSFSAKVGVGRGGWGRWSCKKKDIHPGYYENAKVYCNGEHVMTTGGTQPEYVVDVWSGNHPFYLGNRSALLVDADQVEKFRKKFGELSNIMEIPVLKGEIILPTKKKSPGKGKKK